MRLWIPLVMLAVALWGTAQPSDSLRTAIDAVNRRQRHLGEREQEVEYMLRAYLAATNNYAAQGVGQPEDIGYGFQRTGLVNGAILYSPPQLDDVQIEDEDDEDARESLLQGYVQGDEPIQPHISPFRELEKKSWFREQQRQGDALKKLRQLPADPQQDEYEAVVRALWPRYQEGEEHRVSEADVAHIQKYLQRHGILRHHPKPSQNYVNDEQDYDEREDTRGDTYYSPKFGVPAFRAEYPTDAYISEADVYNDEDIPKYGDRWLALDEYAQQEEPLPLYDSQRKRGLAPATSYEVVEPSSHRRFNIAKRSLDSFGPAPAHHHTKSTNKYYYAAKESSGPVNLTTTDPKVMNELNQLFSDDDDDLNDVEADAKAHEDHDDDNEVVTKQIGADQNPLTKRKIIMDVSEKSGRTRKNKKKSHNESNMEEELATPQQEDEPIEIKKKSIDWSDYFGIDRRRKKFQTNPAHHFLDSSDENEIPEEWLQENFEKLASKVSPVGRDDRKLLQVYKPSLKRSHMSTQPFDPRSFQTETSPRNSQKRFAKKNDKNDEDNNTESLKFDHMDKKLQRIEDQILNQAVRYTGAHEDTTDAQEIQKVKTNVISQLAAAYSLEKIRKALGDFQTILASQRNSDFYNNDDGPVVAPSKIKRRAVKGKPVVKEARKSDIMNRSVDNEGLANSVNQLLDAPAAMTQLSEGYMGDEKNRCVSVSKLLDKCRSQDDDGEDDSQIYAPLCCLRQLCYACAEAQDEHTSHCEMLLVDACGDDGACVHATRRCGLVPLDPGQCACVARFLVTE